jgi:hypothetical protein
MIIFSHQPNGESEQLILAIIDVSSSPTATSNTISIDTQLNQIA